jgi:hypothetical protein
MRSASGMLVAPMRRMSSCVITEMAAGEANRPVSFLETEVTCTFTNCSSVKFSKSPAGLGYG